MSFLKNKIVLVTGAAGFIGANLCKRLLNDNPELKIVGVDNLNDYYDPDLKKWRLNQINECSDRFEFIQGNIADKKLISEVFKCYSPNIVVNLAAQAGVRHSISNPDSYIESNIIGFYNILEASRHSYDNNMPGVEHLVFASSSSVYGANTKIPYSTDDRVDNPVSLYAATKKSDELLAHAYSKLYNIPTTGLRFFTVYGPAGRPDMAYFSFTDKLVRGEDIKIFNYGNCQRDFTYIDDTVEGLIRVIMRPPARSNGADGLPIAPYKIYNLGNNHPENLLAFVKILQEQLIAADMLPKDFDLNQHCEMVAMQPGDVPITYADTSQFEKDFGFQPSTSLEAGLKAFAQWYRSYYTAEGKS